MTAPTGLPPPEEGTSTRLFPKGRLKIFLGASPGVGKTFAMLQAAAERKQEGVDVVIGLVETHQRKETELQLKNIEILPRKIITYRGKTFEELDLDGILARSPQLVLIDECAHTNLPSSRHPKRYNDITEILEYGIDVYTTLNVQHFESLKDIVEQMTHITVRESVPDSFIQSANEVQLIDLPPDDLLQRLADGKVYVPEQAKVAIEHFFNRSNLLTLRELALRHTVAVADDKMTRYVQQRGIKGPWPASDKVMVCVGTEPSNPNLVRTAHRMANRMQAKWIAVTIETPDDETRTIPVQQQLSHTLHLAKELGAEEVIALDGTDVTETLIQHALTNNVTEMVIGQSHAPKTWQKIPLVGRLFKKQSIAEKILSRRLSFALRVIPTEEGESRPISQTRPNPLLIHILLYTVSLVMTFGMFFLAGGRGKIIFLSFIFIFIFAVFILPNLVIHSRKVFSSSQGRLRQIRFFSGFIQRLTHCAHKDEILSLLCQEIHQFLSVSVIAFWEIPESLKPTVQYPETKDVVLTEMDVNAIQWALANQIRSGRSTDNFSNARYLYLPIKIGNNSLGVVGIWALKDQLTMDDFCIAQTVIDQAALAIDRLNHIKIGIRA